MGHAKPRSSRQSAVRGSVALCAACAALASAIAGAQTYPRSPIHLIVPYTPGGATDLIGRQLGSEMSKRLGQPVVIDNRPGAAGTIGMKMLTAARPDGYTLGLGTSGTVSVDPVQEKLPYNPTTDMIAVAPVVAIYFVVFANPSFPPNNIRELIALAKRSPGKINFASSGTGGSPHLASELLMSRAGIRLQHIPYKGAAPAITDVVSGQVEMMTGDANTALPFLKSGRLKALAVTGPERMEQLPNVPTVAETLPGFEAGNWFGVFVPAGTPPAIVDTLFKAVQASVETPEFKQRIAPLGGRTLQMSRTEFDRYISAQTRKRSDLIRDNKIDLGK
ncbi:MAG: tripartite tricarboxylate transporter substrate binding protein [Burkholderiales bacterium]|nr:tripartite tricarboxylate transporter substrate binding protein [Burkholderiales bacterium]